MTTAIVQQYVLGKDIASKAIGWFSSGYFSHVDCVLPDRRLLGARSDHVGGAGSGVYIRTANYEPWVRRVMMVLPCSITQRGQYHRFLLDQLGKPYDMQAIAAFLFNRDWREPDSWICSELQCAAGEAAGVLPKLYMRASKITPVACALAYSAAGGRFYDAQDFQEGPASP